MIKVGWDAGHGYNTAGKRTPDGEREWSFNDKVGRAFANELALYSGVASKRFDDPSGKTDVPLNTRTTNARTWGATVYISFHKNAFTGRWGTATGVETHVFQTPNAASIALANALHPVLVKGYGLPNRGIKKTNLHITREMQPGNRAVVLLEGPFMDNRVDVLKLRDDKVLANVGKLLAQALAKHLGLKKTQPVTTPTKGGLTMGQYEELNAKIQLLTKVIEAMQPAKERPVLKDHAKGWKWANDNKIISNISPQRTVTREQLATILYAMEEKK